MDKTYIDKLALIEIQNKKVLVTRTKGRNAYYIPGGKREEKEGSTESDEQALMREIKQELSIELKRETIKPYGIFEAQAHNQPEGTIVKVTAYTAEYSGVPRASAEIEEITWLDYSGRDKVGPVLQLIMDDLRAQNLIDGSIEGKEALIEAARQRRAEWGKAQLETDSTKRL